jgi:hypothetical protein
MRPAVLENCENVFSRDAGHILIWPALHDQHVGKIAVAYAGRRSEPKHPQAYLDEFIHRFNPSKINGAGRISAHTIAACRPSPGHDEDADPENCHLPRFKSLTA